MDAVRKFEPLWGAWYCECVIGEGGFGRVYRAVRTEGNQRYYSAIKHISVPASDQQLQEARRSGMYHSEKELSDYFNDIAHDVRREIDLMYTLRNNKNIVTCEDHVIFPKSDGIGCDIFIRMELLRDLNSCTTENLPAETVVKIGTDICSALEVCAKSNIVHRDIKPSNIFVNSTGDFKLGDFGIAKVLSGSTTGMSKKGTYSYMAPEIYKCEPANLTSDIYSLGIVLYKLLNNNRLPFLPVTGSIRAQDQENAMMKLISGAQMPPPVNASSQLSAVILKACSYNMRSRFRTPAEFRKALIDALNGVYYDPNDATRIDIAASPTIIDSKTQLNYQPIPQPVPQPAAKKKGKGGVIAAVIVSVLLIGVLVIGIISGSGGYYAEEDDSYYYEDSYYDENDSYEDETEYYEPEPEPEPEPVITYPAPEFPKITASSSINNGKSKKEFNEIRAFDGDLTTCWLENVKGPGKDEWIKCSADTVQYVNSITLYPGYCLSNFKYYDNNRPTRVRIELDVHEFIFDIEDSYRTPSVLTFDEPVACTWVKITLIDSVPGEGWDDTGFSEIIIE